MGYKPILRPAAQLAAPDENQDWLAEWRQCILEGAWRALESHQRRSPENFFYTVLRLSADYPEDDSKALAARTTEVIARPISAEAFRKQFSRARRKFAELLVEEVARTVADPNQVENELIEVGLMKYVHDFLSEDWASKGKKTNPAYPE